VIGKHQEKLALGESRTINTALLSEVEPRRDADIVVDCTGSATGLPTALSLVSASRTIVLKTTVAGEQTLALAPVVIDEVTILGSRCGPFDRALTALDAGEVSVSADDLGPLRPLGWRAAIEARADKARAQGPDRRGIMSMMLRALAIAALAAISIRVPDLDGTLVDPFRRRPAPRATVFLFVSTDCPIQTAMRRMSAVSMRRLRKRAWRSGWSIPTPQKRQSTSATTSSRLPIPARPCAIPGTSS